MKYRTVPEYQLERLQRVLEVDKKVSKEVLRGNRWYCSTCGIIHNPKYGLESNCDNCGRVLEKQ